MKSLRQADFTAARCASVGAAVADLVAGAGCDWAGAAEEDFDFVLIAETAFRQAAEREPLCCCRQVSASMPPGVTPEHCAMKSERHAALIWSFCCCDGCCAVAIPVLTTK